MRWNVNHVTKLLLFMLFFTWPAQAKYDGGTGTAEDPYLINTAEQMNAIGAEPNDWDKHFKLTADIDLSGYKGTEFNLIGQSYENPFNGLIDGNCQTIDRFTFSDTSGRGIGLISYLGTSGYVKNLILTDANVEGHTYVGPLVGYSRGVVQNCQVKGTAKALGYTGGIVGISISEGLITECHADVNVSGIYEIGGIAGANSNSIISFCSATGSVVGRETTGGITGRQDNSMIHDCQSTCVVSGKYRAIGGLLGRNYSSIVSRCYSIGSVVGTDGADRVGGLVGESSGIITDCYSQGCIEAQNQVGGLVGKNEGVIAASFSSSGVHAIDEVGGLVGYNKFNAEIINCYANGDVLGRNDVGGLVGNNVTAFPRSGSVWSGRICNCYSASIVLGAQNVGGLVGHSGNEGMGGVSSSFWDIEASGQIISDGGDGKTTAQMQDPNMFIDVGWDFVDESINGIYDIWRITEAKDYPRLWWQSTEDGE